MRPRTRRPLLTRELTPLRGGLGNSDISNLTTKSYCVDVTLHSVVKAHPIKSSGKIFLASGLDSYVAEPKLAYSSDRRSLSRPASD